MHKAKSLREWIETYESKAKDKFEIPEGFVLFYMAERGFATMKLDLEGKIMMVWQVCGDGQFWRDYGELRGIELGMECIASICTRPIRPYIRAFGWEILKEYCNEGRYRFLCQDSAGRKVIITHKKDAEGDEPPQYWVTHYFFDKAITELNEDEVKNDG